MWWLSLVVPSRDVFSFTVCVGEKVKVTCEKRAGVVDVTEGPSAWLSSLGSKSQQYIG